MKITKLLPIALAMSLCTGAVFADPSESANELYQLDVATFFNVTHAAGNDTADITVDDTYTTATITGKLSGTYTVITNHSEDIYLYGSCEAQDGTAHALYGTPADLKLIFANTEPEETTHLATKSQIADMMTGDDHTKSPNAIAFGLKVTPTLDATTAPPDTEITTAAALDETNHSLKYDLPNCNATFLCEIEGSSKNSSLSTLDQIGAYQATLYLTNTAPSAQL